MDFVLAEGISATTAKDKYNPDDTAAVTKTAAASAATVVTASAEAVAATA